MKRTVHGSRAGSSGRHLAEVVLMGALGLGFSIWMIGFMRAPGWPLATVVPAVGVGALWVGLALVTTFRWEPALAGEFGLAARVSLTLFLLCWAVLAVATQVEIGQPWAKGLAMLVAPALCTFAIWTRPRPYRWARSVRR
ncbi:MAG: hypothetical protein ACREQM_06615 [Candidatus Dormibacteraceae bacterium]